MPAPYYPSRTYPKYVPPSQIRQVTIPPTIYTSSLTGGLSFTGIYGPTSTKKALPGISSFVGSVPRNTFRQLFAAVGTSAGLIKKTIRSYSGTLSFIGATLKRLLKVFTASMAFVGSKSNRTFKSLTAALSFLGGFVYPWRQVSVLNFVGSIAKRMTRSFKATLFPGGGAAFPSTGCTAYYKLDEGAGTTRNDSVGSNNLTDHATVGSSTGKIGNAASFVSASSQYLSCADAAAFQMGTGSFSVSLWIKYTSTTGTIFAYGNPAGGGGSTGFGVQVFGGNGGLLFRFRDTTINRNSSSSHTWNDGSWHHVVLVVDRAANLLGYVDNSLEASVDATAVTGSVNNSIGFQIGAANSSPSLDASVDELAVYNRVLSPTDIATLWNGGAGVTYGATGSGLAATLTLKVIKALGAGLSFVGDFVKNLISGGILYFQSFTATLWGAGGGGTPAAPWNYTLAPSATDTDVNQGDSGFAWSSQITLVAGSVTKIRVFIGSNNADGRTIKAALYDTSFNLITSGSATLSISDSGLFKDVAVTPASVSAGNYLIAWTTLANASDTTYRALSGSGTGGVSSLTGGFSGFPQSVLDTPFAYIYNSISAGAYLYNTGLPDILDEDFEGGGAPPHFVGSGANVFDYTGVVLSGTQSCRLYDDGTSHYTLCPYPPAAEIPEAWVKLLLRAITASSNHYIAPVINTSDGSFNTGGNFTLNDSMGGTVDFGTWQPFSFGTTYFVWLHHHQNTIFEVWWNTVDDRATATYVSTTMPNYAFAWIEINPYGTPGDVVVDNIQIASTDIFAGGGGGPPTSVATLTLRTGKVLSAALSFIGGVAKRIPRSFSATLFSGSVSTDSYPIGNASAESYLYAGFNTKWGQVFQSSGGKLIQARFVLDRNGSPTGTINAVLYAVSGTPPTAIATGSPLATSDPRNVTDIVPAGDITIFTFSGANQITLTAGTWYAIVFEFTSTFSDSSDHPGIYYDVTSSTDPGNLTYFDGAAWQYLSANDTIYYVDYTILSVAKLTRLTGRAFTAVLSFVGDFIKNLVAGGTAYFQNFTATLFGAGGGVPNLINEDFEGSGTPVGWTAFGANFDYTSAPLAGSQSLRAPTGANGAYYELSPTRDELWGQFLFETENALPASSEIIISWLDSGFGGSGISLWSDGRITVNNGATFSVGSISPNTIYYVWWHYKKGASSTGSVEAWFNTTNSRPVRGSNNYIGSTAVTTTQSITYVIIPDVINSIGNSNTADIYDNFQVATTDVFGGGAPSGTLTLRTVKALRAALNWIGDMPRSLSHTLSATLSFVGSFVKKTLRSIAASLSLIGTLAKRLTLARASFTATLSFVGVILRKANRTLAAALSFIGVDAFRTSKSLIASVSFTGLLQRGFRLVRSSFTAAVSFIGSLKGIGGKLLAGTLSFVGTANKKALRLFSATLDLIGNLASLLSHLGSHFLQFTSNLDFIGNLNQRTSRALASTLSFIGSLGKRIPKAFTATMSFIGTLAKRGGRSIAATLSFISALSTRQLLARVFTATQNFSGSFIRRTSRTLAAALSFVGNLGRRLPLRLAATLAFTGNLVKQAGKRFSGLVSYIGSLAFTGELVQLFEATLAFSGHVGKSAVRTIEDSLSFVGDFFGALSHIGERFAIAFTSTVSFTGSIIRRIGQVIKIGVARIIQAIHVGLFKETIAIDVALPKPIDEVKIQVQEDTELVSVSTAGNPAEIEITVPGDIDN